MTDLEPAALSIQMALEKLASDSLTSEALTKSVLNRIEVQDEQLHAYVSVFGKTAVERAKLMDRKKANSCSQDTLCGVPIAIKDLFDIAGHSTRAGSLTVPDIPAKTTAPCVQKLIDAGASIIGKTQTVEFAFGGWGTNSVMGTPWNPWDRETHRVPGGSSSGSAVAVASGMAMAALGTDTGGSVRTPASYCGLVGTKTSSGLISTKGVFPLCPTHDTVGTLTRTVGDAALLLAILCEPGPGAWSGLNRSKNDFMFSLDEGIENLKIGVLGQSELAVANNDIVQLFQRAVRILADAGADISEHILPLNLRFYLDEAGRLMSFESYQSLKSLVETEGSLVAPANRARILAGADITEDNYREMLRQRKLAQEDFLANLENYHALVMPTCSSTAIPVAEVDETAIVTPFGRFVNYLDLAAVSVPMGVCQDGLPSGLQIVVRKYDDALALRIARSIERSIGTQFPDPLSAIRD